METRLTRALTGAAVVLTATATTPPGRPAPIPTPPATFDVCSLADTLRRDRYAVVPAHDLWALLASLGARESDIEAAGDLWEEAVPQRDEDGNVVYAHKGTLTTYYDVDTDAEAAEAGLDVVRSSSRDATAVDGHTIEHIDPTTENGGLASYYR